MRLATNGSLSAKRFRRSVPTTGTWRAGAYQSQYRGWIRNTAFLNHDATAVGGREREREEAGFRQREGQILEGQANRSKKPFEKTRFALRNSLFAWEPPPFGQEKPRAVPGLFCCQVDPCRRAADPVETLLFEVLQGSGLGVFCHSCIAEAGARVGSRAPAGRDASPLPLSLARAAQGEAAAGDVADAERRRPQLREGGREATPEQAQQRRGRRVRASGALCISRSQVLSENPKVALGGL